MHLQVRDINTKLMKQAKKYNFITPRDFLDFIKHFIDLRTDKKSELVELQSHLKMGLDKLKESEDEVVQLQGELKKYSSELAG
jgi:dynein heavy chain 1